MYLTVPCRTVLYLHLTPPTPGSVSYLSTHIHVYIYVCMYMKKSRNIQNILWPLIPTKFDMRVKEEEKKNFNISFHAHSRTYTESCTSSVLAVKCISTHTHAHTYVYEYIHCKSQVLTHMLILMPVYIDPCANICS